MSVDLTRPWAPRAASSRPTVFHRTLVGHTGPVLGVAWGVLEGRAVAISASDDRTLRVWDLATGRSVVIPVLGEVHGVACRSSGAQPGALSVAVGTDRAFLVLELNSTVFDHLTTQA